MSRESFVDLTHDSSDDEAFIDLTEEDPPHPAVHATPLPKSSSSPASPHLQPRRSARDRRPVAFLHPEDFRTTPEFDLGSATNKVKNACVIKVTADGRGLGLFAARDLTPGDNVAHIPGRYINREAKERLHTAERQYCVQINDDLFIDASNSPRNNPAKCGHLINHSYTPNCVLKVVGRSCLIVVRSPVRVGEELTANYGQDYVKEHMPEVYETRPRGK
jgi:hypothetical protein